VPDQGSRCAAQETPLRAYGAVTHCCERAFDDVGRAQMLPMLGWEVVEGAPPNWTVRLQPNRPRILQLFQARRV
jgi:hypothetical protein